MTLLNPAHAKAVFAASLLALTGGLAGHGDAAAQWGYTPPAPQAPEPVRLEDYVTTNVATTLPIHGENLLGDRISPDTGALSFRHVDVNIPGNSDLPVMLGRYIDANSERHVNFGADMPISSNGNQWAQSWSMMIPHIMTRTAHDGSWHSNRCTTPSDEPNLTVSYQHGQSAPAQWAGRYGIRFYSPEEGLRPLLNGNNSAFSANPPDYVTKDYWRVDCLSGANGEYFEVTSPSGHIYTLDQMYTYKSGQTYQPRFPGGVDWSSGLYDASENHVAYVSEVRDQFGNWVRYEYDDTVQGVSRIHSNDGREIQISYANGSVSSVTANGRTWTYSYTNNVLDQVTLPDGRSWTIGNLDGVGHVVPWIFGQRCYFGTDAYMRHPDGVEGFFTTEKIVNFQGDSIFGSTQSSARAQCMSRAGNYTPGTLYNTGTRRYDDWRNFFSSAVTEKRLVIPGAPDAVWTYDYEDGDHYSTNVWATSVGPDPTDTTSTRKRRTVANPAGHVTRLEFDIRFDTEGTLLRRDIYEDAAAVTPIQTEVFDHTLAAQWVGGIVDMNYGASINAHIYHNQRTRRTLTRDGETYTVDMTYDGFNQVTDTSAYSTLGGGTRTTEIDFLHDTVDWFLGLPTRVTVNGRVFEETSYNADHQPHIIRHFGDVAATLSYDAQGRLSALSDGLNRQTLLGNYHRGRPRSVTRPDGAQLSWTVDDNGWITGTTDAVGTTTGYSYNAIGWPTLINRPAGFADTTISYSNLGFGTVQTATRGAERIITQHDGLNRTTQVERRAIAYGGGSVFTRYEYDGLSRTVFASLPSAGSNPTTGVETSYDALGRVTLERENVSPFAATTTEYLSDNRTRVTNPSGDVTTLWASGWGSPSDGATVQIDHPLGLTTNLGYDAWGALTSARQHGSHSGFAVDETQTWSYDSRMRVCRHTTPETGATLYTYDAANQITGMGRGLAAGSACGSIPSGDRIAYTYNALSQPTLIDYPSGTTDIALAYDANGNVLQNARGGVVWNYAYDLADRLVSETLSLDGRSYAASYSYNADGALIGRTNPTGRAYTLDVDGFGRPTRLSDPYGNTPAYGVSYHANGALATQTYSDGHVMTVTQDARQQMTRMRTTNGTTLAVDFTYQYDATGRVTQVNDLAGFGGLQTYTYDALSRLSAASGPWGSASYSYDVLGNIRQRRIGARTVDIEYDATNRVSRVRDSANGAVWRNYVHDPRGNVTYNGLIQFTYDHANQPTSISGSDSGSFVYDGHNRRVKQIINGETIYSVYSVSGGLMLRDNTTTGVATEYVEFGGRTIGRWIGAAYQTQHQNHLGSAVAATWGNQVLWRDDYLPFGESRQAPSLNADNQGFTGHVQDTDTGLTYMQARYYDPAIGRFLSNDPVGFSAGGTGYFNRYAYVRNNPLNLTDPTGMFFQDQQAEFSAEVSSRVYGPITGRGAVAVREDSITLSGRLGVNSADARPSVNVGMTTSEPVTESSVAARAVAHANASANGNDFSARVGIEVSSNDGVDMANGVSHPLDQSVSTPVGSNPQPSQPGKLDLSAGVYVEAEITITYEDMGEAVDEFREIPEDVENYADEGYRQYMCWGSSNRYSRC